MTAAASEGSCLSHANRYTTRRGPLGLLSREQTLLIMPAAKRKAAPQETEVQRCMRILDVLTFEPLRSMIEKPDLLLEYKRFLPSRPLRATLMLRSCRRQKKSTTSGTLTYSTRSIIGPPARLWGAGFIDHYPNGGADAAAREARRKACFDAYTGSFGPAPLGVRSLPWAGVRTPLAPRPQQPPPPAVSGDEQAATHSGASGPARERAGRRLVCPGDGRAPPGRNDRWTTRQEPGWIVCKRDKCVVIYREDRAGIHVVSPGERVTLAHFQKPMPDSAKSAVPAEQDRVFIRVCNQKGDVIHCILRRLRRSRG